MKYATALIFLWGILAAQPAVQTPRPSPELNIKLSSGQEFQLSKLRGKVVALEFIFTTCGHCQRFSEATNQLFKEYGQRGFRAVGVAFNGDADQLAPAFVTQYNLAYPIGTCTTETMLEYLGIPAQPLRLPQLIFIDRRGLMRSYYNGDNLLFDDPEVSMRKVIEQLLAEPAPAGSVRHAAKRKQ